MTWQNTTLSKNGNTLLQPQLYTKHTSNKTGEINKEAPQRNCSSIDKVSESLGNLQQRSNTTIWHSIISTSYNKVNIRKYETNLKWHMIFLLDKYIMSIIILISVSTTNNTVYLDIHPDLPLLKLCQVKNLFGHKLLSIHINENIRVWYCRAKTAKP